MPASLVANLRTQKSLFHDLHSNRTRNKITSKGFMHLIILYCFTVYMPTVFMNKL